MLLKFSQPREGARSGKARAGALCGVLAQESHQALSGWPQVPLIYSSNSFFLLQTFTCGFEPR